MWKVLRTYVAFNREALSVPVALPVSCSRCRAEVRQQAAHCWALVGSLCGEDVRGYHLLTGWWKVTVLCTLSAQLRLQLPVMLFSVHWLLTSMPLTECHSPSFSRTPVYPSTLASCQLLKCLPCVLAAQEMIVFCFSVCYSPYLMCRAFLCSYVLCHDYIFKIYFLVINF